MASSKKPRADMVQLLRDMGMTVVEDVKGNMLDLAKLARAEQVKRQKTSKKAASKRVKFEILPGVGMGPIRFGMKPAQVRKLLKEAGIPLTAKGETLDYFGDENGLQVEYTDGTASFIGLAQEERIDAKLYGVNPFDVPAKKLFELIAKKDGKKKHRYDEFEYVFRDPVVTLYEADPQYDRKTGRRAIWGQIGVGDERYASGLE